MLEISRQLISDLLARAREAAPQEYCGALIGYSGVVGDRIMTLFDLPNLSSEAGQFRLDPEDLRQLLKKHGGQNLRPLGLVHSHLNASAHPSRADRAGHWRQVIVSTDVTSVAPIRSWWPGPHGWQEEVLRISENPRIRRPGD